MVKKDQPYIVEKVQPYNVEKVQPYYLGNSRNGFDLVR